jgi:hypothetical protein
MALTTLASATALPCDRLASAILDNKDFWLEAKEVCCGKSGLQSTVDGLSQPDDIANLFAREYEDLYSCVGYDEGDMTSLKRDINDKIMQDGYDVLSRT